MSSTDRKRGTVEARSAVDMVGGGKLPDRPGGHAGSARTPAQLRRFGLVMFVPLAALGGLFLWRGRAAGPWFLGAAGLFLLAALVAPRILAPIERVWMWLAQVLGRIMTTVILTLTYFVVITPLGLVLRLAGKDPLTLKFDPGADSYWVPVEEEGPGTRPDKPY